jgi:hypothetical protein
MLSNRDDEESAVVFCFELQAIGRPEYLCSAPASLFLDAQTVNVMTTVPLPSPGNLAYP